ncbi:MAG: helix-turn-helix domain-containing protein [Candidatus Nanopelagicales bacterium]
MTRRPTARGAATRARLLAATRQVVADSGHSHATTRAIAEAAGVSEGTIYRHFPDKLALFLAAVIDANAPIIESLSHLPARAGQGTVAGNVAEALGRLAAMNAQLLPLEIALLSDPELGERQQARIAQVVGAVPDDPPSDDGAAGPVGPDSAAAMAAVIAGMPGPAHPPQLIADYLSAEQRLGRVRADLDPLMAALTILALLRGVALVPVPMAGHSQVREHLLRAAADLLTRGLID